MKKFIKLLLLLLVSITVDSKNTCTDACPLKLNETKIKTAYSDQLRVDENDWILQTRFKY